MAKEINLKEFFHVIRNRLWIIIVLTILATLTGYLYSAFFKAPSLYTSSTRLVIGANKDNMNTLNVLMKDPIVLEKVSKEIQNTRSPGMLATEITAGDIDSSQVVSISVIDPDPRMAAQIANLTASIFKSEAASVLNFRDIRLLAEAKPDSTPINPGNHHKVIYGGIFGFVVGIGLVFFLNSLDESIRSEKELENILEAPVLGTIHKMKKKNMLPKEGSQDLRKNTLTSLQSETENGIRSRRMKKGSHDDELSFKDSNSVQRVQH